MRPAARVSSFLTFSFLRYLLPPLPLFLSRRGRRPDEPSRGHAERELEGLLGPHRYG
jgi:hypothetical protein